MQKAWHRLILDCGTQAGTSLSQVLHVFASVLNTTKKTPNCGESSVFRFCYNLDGLRKGGIQDRPQAEPFQPSSPERWVLPLLRGFVSACGRLGRAEVSTGSCPLRPVHSGLRVPTGSPQPTEPSGGSGGLTEPG